MEFNCPACGAPHAFPEDQIPAGGIVVACTKCSTHITLDGAGVVQQPDKTEALSAVPAPPKPSARPGPPPPSGPPPDIQRSAPANRPPASSGVMTEIPMPDNDEHSVFGGPPQNTGTANQPNNEPPTMERDSGMLDAAARAMSSAASAAKDVAKDVGRAAERAFDNAAAEEIEAETDVPEGLAFPGFRPSASGLWTWRDLPRAFIGVFDKSRFMFAVGGFWAAFVVFGLVNWLGGFLGAKVWGMFGTIFSVVAWLGLAGVAFFVYSVLGYVVHQTVVEQRASSIKGGVAWAKQWIKSVIGTPIAFVVVVAAIGLAEGVIGALGRIPFAGPIVWGVASGAIVVASLAAGAVLVAMVYTLPLYVPIIYNEKTGPKETLKRLYGMFRQHGFSLIGYVLVTVVTIGFAFFVTVMPALTAATAMTARVGMASMGPNFAGTIANVPGPFIGHALLNGGVPIGAGETGFGHTLGGIFAGLGMTVGSAVVVAIVALTYVTAGCIIYSIVTGRKKA